ncbi:double-strand break repair protein MRE11 [Angomonas deanei]|uniref:Double-strand break repair protein n=1 Tax=Angomonas deanei TaxID=59799 RepID=A0A7G2CTD1_9TRYP|nr:double-strand break repair protein MRE11 [Angomonas deanei]CAD2221482.1 Calcineurin-like phosphoesterase/Mre11 DNA-binding presumed domain containing protein, putative [Angomonas deanei]|eukprot:EPY32927.1 double-strand break repair protein MRE11 [Angomonas deanei]
MPPKKSSNSPKRKPSSASPSQNNNNDIAEQNGNPSARPSSGDTPASTSSDRHTFKFLISTDNHLGFVERDPRRGDDSFTTFEEILRAARVEHEVDALLLGGDLFHDNKPSLGCLARTQSLFRKYVFGDKEVEFTLLSDPRRNFPTHALPVANFQDPNVNIATPVFAIHGNHDDPVGGTSALDLLATASCINYFGHVQSLEEIVVEPVLLKKGDTHVALYGLGNVRDERLHRCFRDGKVHFLYPKPQEGVRWFNILLLHQNRGVRGRGGPGGTKAGIYEEMLSSFQMDLVIWGNEHEQLMMPQPSPAGHFDVVQPGSSIYTSLSIQESNPKQYGVLEVRGTAYRLTPFNLKSVRPVVRRTVLLCRDNPRGRTLEAVEEYLREVVVQMVEEAEQQVAAIPEEVVAFHPNVIYPLMRLSVDFSDPDSAPFPQPNFNRFGQQYTDVIANANDLLKPIKPKATPSLGTVISRARQNDTDGPSEFVYPVAPNITTTDIRAKVAEVFYHNAKDACVLLPEHEVSAAVYAFVEKGERDAIDERISELISITQKAVWREFDNGKSDSILKTDKIVDAVHRHKKEMNMKFVETEKSNLKEMIPNEEEEEEVAVDASATDRSAEERDDNPFLLSENSLSVPPTTKTERKTHYPDYEELPGDGLDRSSVQHIVNEAITISKGSTAAGKRARAAPTRQQDDEEIIVVDEDDEAPPARVKRETKAKPRGRAAAKRDGRTGGGPSLHLTTNVGSGLSTTGNNNNNAVLNVIAQWGNASQSK